mmetsp:Transcript_12464/g.25373  ORF Transcript_12464/g.25373 Transcript_12464/m.25373 type:complete len:321 (+) Transcript_12464:784-1746(+)
MRELEKSLQLGTRRCALGDLLETGLKLHDVTEGLLLRFDDLCLRGHYLKGEHDVVSAYGLKQVVIFGGHVNDELARFPAPGDPLYLAKIDSPPHFNKGVLLGKAVQCLVGDDKNPVLLLASRVDLRDLVGIVQLLQPLVIFVHVQPPMVAALEESHPVRHARFLEIFDLDDGIAIPSVGLAPVGVTGIRAHAAHRRRGQLLGKPLVKVNLVDALRFRVPGVLSLAGTAAGLRIAAVVLGSSGSSSSRSRSGSSSTILRAWAGGRGPSTARDPLTPPRHVRPMRRVVHGLALARAAAARIAEVQQTHGTRPLERTRGLLPL